MSDFVTSPLRFVLNLFGEGGTGEFGAVTKEKAGEEIVSVAGNRGNI
jgi:hypothetical protein